MSSSAPVVPTPAYLSFSLLALQHSINLADQKTSVIMASSGAFFTYLLSRLAGYSETGASTLSWYLTSASALVMMVAILLSYSALLPRIRPVKSDSLSFWTSSAFDLNDADLMILTRKNEEGDGHLALALNHLSSVAHIARAKYMRLRTTFQTALFGLSLFCVANLVQIYRYA
jgi:hypothetical protein